MELDNKLRAWVRGWYQAGKIHNLHQVCAVPGCVVVKTFCAVHSPL